MSLKDHCGSHVDECHQLVHTANSQRRFANKGKAAQKAFDEDLDDIQARFDANPRLPYTDGVLRE
jgi:hypothetical protein